MAQRLNIGMIGLDTSHCPAFADLLNNTEHPYHVPGGQVVVGFPGGSPDFEVSAGRVEKFTKDLQEKHGLDIVDSPEEVAQRSDAILLTSVDGRVHLPQFERIASYGKPVFIDKPLAVSSADAAAIAALAEKHGVSWMSASSLRYSASYTAALSDDAGGAIVGVDAYGPMAILPPLPGLYWYGIHTVEMLYAALGKGCKEVVVTRNEDIDLVVGTWEDGRVGTIRGARKGAGAFGAVIHREKDVQFVDTRKDTKPAYAGLLERVMEMFDTGHPAVANDESLEVIRFIEAANESREHGRPVRL